MFLCNRVGAKNRNRDTESVARETNKAASIISMVIQMMVVRPLFAVGIPIFL